MRIHKISIRVVFPGERVCDLGRFGKYAMDGKAIPLGKSLSTGDTRYLQQELGSVLPPALATVTELQPTDPITALALWLYKYRELNPLPVRAVADTSDIQDIPSGIEPAPHPATTTVTKPPVTDAQRVRPLPQIVQRNDDDDDDIDFIEDSGYEGSIHLKTAVHQDVKPMLTNIGDLFDDDDLG